MKLKILITLLVVTISISLVAKNSWNQTNKKATLGIEKINRSEIPKTALTYSINLNEFKTQLGTAPLRNSFTKSSNTIVNFPTSTGQIESFMIFDAPIMHPDLAARYPEIKSYVGYGVDNPSLSVRFSYSPQKGISATITNVGKKTTFIEPYTIDLNTYLVYSRSSDDFRIKKFDCLTQDIPQKEIKTNNKNADDDTLRTFRLAMSATAEYTAYHGGTKPQALAAINATMTRVNGVYETDFAITMVLIANTDAVIYTNSATDPYTSSLNSELQSTLTANIGELNYDIGHLVHQETNSNGNAGCIGCVCDDGQKGSAFTSHITPTGDDFDIDFVAHEMGHQFGGNHTFTQGFAPENSGAQMEPGSGSTIMGYAGITGASDVQAHSDDYFHFFTIQQITNNVASKGCHTRSNMVNAAPVASAGNDYTIPHSTAYILEGSGTDSDPGNVLTFCWEQGDEGFESKTSVSSAPNSGMSPSFRSFPPTTNTKRYIPKLSSVINDSLTTQWETVMTQAGVMNMTLTVRDNVVGGGQNHNDKMIVTVDGSSGPFTVTSQNSSVTWTGNTTETITWDVANTTASPVSTPNVDVFLSTDGGVTFPITLASAIPNNGSATVTVPNNPTSSARIMVRGAGNIFYAVNRSNFTITSSIGISELGNDKISIYPNPTKDIINIDFKTNTNIDKISVVDVQGKIVFLSTKIKRSSIRIDLSDLSNGVYTLQIQSKEAVSTNKIVKH